MARLQSHTAAAGGTPRVATSPRRVPASAPVLAGQPSGELASLPIYPYVPLFATLLFSGYVVLWYLQVGYRVSLLGQIRFELLYAIGLGVIAVLCGPTLSSPVTGYLVALLLCMAIQVPFSYDFDTSWNVFIDRVLKFFWMALFIVAFVKGPRQLKWFLGAFLLACFKLGQEGFTGQLTGSLVWQNQGVMRLHGPTPIYEHPNSFAGMALGTLPFVFYLFPLCRWKARAVLAAIATFSLTIILFTGSRTGYIGFVAFVAVVILKSKRKFVSLATIALVSVLTVPLIPAEYVERFSSIYTGVDKEGHSTELRMEILRDAWQIFTDHPLGVGVSAFPAIRRHVFARTQDTHNLYLEVATNLGIQGFIVFLLFITAILWQLAKLARGFDEQMTSIRSSGPPGEDPVSLVKAEHGRDLAWMRQTAHAVQVFVITRLALGFFGMDLYEIYWWFAMGLTIALFKMSAFAQARTAVLAGAADPAVDHTRETRVRDAFRPLQARLATDTRK